jgi:hypothetical protein
MNEQEHNKYMFDRDNAIRHLCDTLHIEHSMSLELMHMFLDKINPKWDGPLVYQALEHALREWDC